jgi:hypothetical protein
MRYRLRTLLILLAVLPPLLGIGWLKYSEWNAERQRRTAQFERRPAFTFDFPAGASSPGAASNEEVFSFYIGIAR